MSLKPTEAVLGEARLSYVNLLEPHKANEGAEPKYSVQVLIPKTATETVAEMKRAVEAAVQVGITKNFGGKRPAKIRYPFKDGDGLKENGEEYPPEAKGHWVMNATANVKYPPQVRVGRDRHHAMPEEVYSGVYGYVYVNFAPYNVNGNTGVGCYLNHVLISRDGEPLGGKVSVDEAFKDIEIPEMTIDLFNEIDPLTGLPVDTL